jgi:hypothetical protein
VVARPLHADHAELAATKAATVQAARVRRHPGRPPAPRYVGRFADGMEVLKDGTELHLVSFCLADAELRLAGADDPAFAALKVKYANVLGGAPPGMPPDRGMELELETCGAQTPRSRLVKRLSDGELAELRTQLIDLLDRSWIQHSSAGHAAAVVFARKPNGTWRICYDYRQSTEASTSSRAQQSSRSPAPAHRRAARRHTGVALLRQARSRK